MKTLYAFFLAVCLLTTGMASSQIPIDYMLNQDRMILTNQNILILSSFADQDHISAYSEYGTLLWDIEFYTEVISWKIKEGYLYVFSKSRDVERTHLTCINPRTGDRIWERP